MVSSSWCIEEIENDVNASIRFKNKLKRLKQSIKDWCGVGKCKKKKKIGRKDNLLKHIQGLDKNIDDGVASDVILPERRKARADLGHVRHRAFWSI